MYCNVLYVVDQCLMIPVQVFFSFHNISVCYGCAFYSTYVLADEASFSFVLLLDQFSLSLDGRSVYYIYIFF